MLFLIYIIAFCKDVNSDEFMYADDTSLFKCINNDTQQTMTTINKDPGIMHTWSKIWYDKVGFLSTLEKVQLML